MSILWLEVLVAVDLSAAISLHYQTGKIRFQILNCSTSHALVRLPQMVFSAR